MKTTISFIAILAFLMIGCAPSFKSAGGLQEASTGDELISSYSALAFEIQSAAAGQPSGARGDVSGKSDDELIEEEIKRIQADLEELKKAHADLKADGHDLPDIDFSVLEQGLKDLIEKLQTDADFRAKFIAALRNPPTVPDLSDDLPEIYISPELCKDLESRLNDSSLPELMRRQMQRDYDRECK